MSDPTPDTPAADVAAWALHTAIEPGMEWLHKLGGPVPTPAARTMLLAIGLQESAFCNRCQMGGGPARGFWQFEAGGGVRGVLTHPTSAALAKKACEAACVAPDMITVWRAIEGHDLLACAFARLLLLTDPYSMPTGENEGWAGYSRVWRPGKPDRARWVQSWATARAAMSEAVV